MGLVVLDHESLKVFIVDSSDQRQRVSFVLSLSFSGALLLSVTQSVFVPSLKDSINFFCVGNVKWRSRQDTLKQRMSLSQKKELIEKELWISLAYPSLKSLMFLRSIEGVVNVEIVVVEIRQLGNVLNSQGFKLQSWVRKRNWSRRKTSS